MKKRLFSLLILAAAITVNAQQLDSRAPGIYAVMGDSSVALPYTRSFIISFGGFVKTSDAYFKGATSGIVTDTRTFVLVVDPKKKTFSYKKPFVKDLTPVNSRFLPLVSDVKKDRRYYDIGIQVYDGLIYEEDYGIKFEWEKITDNSFLITIPDNLPAGEYGFSFSLYSLSAYDFFYHIFGFTIPAKQ